MVGPDEAARGGQRGEALVEGWRCGRGRAHAVRRTEAGGSASVSAVVMRSSTELGGGAAGWRRSIDLEGQRIGALREFERDGGHGGRGAVLDREGEIIAIAAQVEIGVAPGVELGGAAQGLAGADVAGALLGVVDDEHGDAHGGAAVRADRRAAVRPRRWRSRRCDAGARRDRARAGAA